MDYIEFVENLIDYGGGTPWYRYARYLTKNFDWEDIKKHVMPLDPHHKNLVLEALKEHGCDLVEEYPELTNQTDMEILLSEYTDADKTRRETIIADADRQLQFWSEALNAIKEIDDNKEADEVSRGSDIK